MNVAASGAARARLKAATIVAAALFVAGQGLLWFAYYGNGAKRLIGDEAAYQQFALDILGGGSWMPSTIWPPLQPLFLAAIYSIAGVHVVAVQLVQTLLFVGCAVLLRAIWRRVDGSVRAANAAAALFLLNPANAAYADWLWPEVPHLFLVLLVFWLLLERPGSRIAAAAAGVCTGLALLAKSLLAAFWPLFLIAFFRSGRPRFRTVPAALFVAGILIATAPALWHGWREFGRPMIADSSIYNLWVGLTDRWRADYVEDMGGATLAEFLASGATPEQRNAVYLRKVDDLVAERGIAHIAADQVGRQYFRLFSAKTPLVSQLPGPACAGHLSVYPASPAVSRTLTIANDFFHALMLAGCAFGIACWRRRPGFAFWLIAAYLAYQLALIGVLHVKARFLFPMIPFLCAFAGTFYAGLRARVAGSDVEGLAFTAPRLALGAIFAALLLVLAFAGPTLDGLCGG
jgi:4-amino-4-deoxy-L-arabinose transferase-like glycosyltransferase